MLEQYFKDDEINIKSHIKGYVSEKDLDKTAIDNQCVTDCNNMDFYPDHDSRRNPFDVYLATLATLITDSGLTDYKIHNICEKRFYDKDGNYADCLIAVVTYQGLSQAQPTKIFINQWYNPGSTYENGSGTASDFDIPEGGWMDITEYYGTSKYTFEAGSWVVGAVTYTLRSDEAVLVAKADNYFKGFFVTHSENRPIGIVTASKVDSGYVYFKVELDSGYAIASTNKLTRFPVTHLNYDNWTAISNVEINKDFPNVVRFYCEEQRPLWFGFLKDKKHFRNFANTWTDGDPLAANKFKTWGNVGHEGYCPQWVDGGDQQIYFKFNLSGAIDIAFYYSYDGATYHYVETQSGTSSTVFNFRVTLDNGVQYFFSFTDTDLNSGNNICYVDHTIAYSHKWDGFWFGFDTPKVINKKRYVSITGAATDSLITYLSPKDISNELGIRYELTSILTETAAFTNYDRVYSFVIEFDGYQNIFVFNALYNLKRYMASAFLGLTQWYDRRISASLIFMLETNDLNSNTIKGGVLETGFLLNDNLNYPGYYKFENMQYYAADTTKAYILLDSITDVATTGTSATYLQATSTLLQTYINNYYWKSTEIEPKGAVKVGDNILAYNLSEDSMNLDKDSKNNITGVGKTALVVSNLQNSGINTPSILVTERIREFARDEILGVKNIYGGSFLLFTETETKWYEVDDTTYIFTNIGNFQYGCIASKSIVEASTQDIAPTGTVSHRFGARMFNGIYWASYDSIYAFFQNEPVDLLEGKWKKEYQELLELTNFDPETDIIGAYNPYTNEVWWWFKLSDSTGYDDCIYIYNIDYKHWKKYSYYQTTPPAATEFIKGFAQSNEGMLYWWRDDNIIYTQEPEGTENMKDYTSGTSKDITFFYEQYINHGNSNIIKTLDRIDLLYDVEPEESGTPLTYTSVKAYIEVKANIAETVILNRDVTTPSGLFSLQTNVAVANANKLYKRRIPMRLRIPNNFIKLKFSSEDTTDSYIKQLKLLQLTINSKISRGTLTKN